MDHDVRIHLENAEEFAQPPDAVVFEVQGQLTGYPNAVGPELEQRVHGRRTGYAMNGELPLQHDRGGISPLPFRPYAVQLEAELRVFVGLHGLVEISIPPSVPGHQRSHRRLHPSADLSE